MTVLSVLLYTACRGKQYGGRLFCPAIGTDHFLYMKIVSTDMRCQRKGGCLVKIGVFGGSFDPIHSGHVELAKAFLQNLSLDLLIVIPAFVSPFKQGKETEKAEHRLEMCRLAFSDMKTVQVSSMELEREGASYTFETLQTLALQYVGSELYFITGADSFMTLQDWKNPQEIFRRAVICVTPRNGQDASVLAKQADFLQGLGARTVILDTEIMTVSSTEIRRRLRCGESIHGYVPEKVEKYIIKNGLYQENGCDVNADQK